MISVTDIRRAFLDNECHTITKAFGYLHEDKAIALIKVGFHPTYLPKVLYNNVVEFVPEKLYLFKPRTVAPLDLISTITKLKNVDKFATHINYHKNSILITGDKSLIVKCMPYMIISDDDIRFIREQFVGTNSIEYILSFINKESVYRMSYQFSENEIVTIINRDHFMYEPIYEHQVLDSDFLKTMLDRYGIVPINYGIIDELCPEAIIEILMAVVRPRDAIRFLDIVNNNQLTENSVKNYIINDIRRGKIDYYIPYAEDFLEDRTEDLGIYANIFFEDAIDITKLEITKTELEHISKYMNYYTTYIDHIVNIILQNNYIDILASIIDYVQDVLTEELCIRIVCESTNPVPVTSLPIHSTLVMVMCIQMKYDDIVEFLDEIDIDTLIEKGADPITEYTFTTRWYNKHNDLITLYIKKYGFCPMMMKRLMFEYPLTKEASDHLLKTMDENRGAIMFFPRTICTLPYLLCCNYKLIQKPIPFKEENRNIVYKKNNRVLCFDSLENSAFKSLIKIDSIPGLKTYNMKDITYEKSNNIICVRFIPQESIHNEERRIKLQLFDIARLASYGLYYIPSRYLSSWTPVVNMIEGREYTNPQKIECLVILDLFSEEFIEYQNLGNAVSNKYELEYTISNYQAAINCLMSTLLIYLVLGSIRSISRTEDFVLSILTIFYKGLKINELLSEPVSGVCIELDKIKDRVSSGDSSFIFLKKNELSKTLSLCEKVCVETILDNNQSFKSSK
uniref:CPXV068 protein n=1 Tax=Cowpox virus TaxID=10243 RepID=A0A6J7ZBN3_COWPX|nr:CPXV068 protein [Cowpox virus]